MGQVKFEITGADTGYNNDQATEPYANGEAALETVFNRPVENLRNRTEVLRKAVHDGLLERMHDRALTIIGDPTTEVTWNGTSLDGGDGTFTLGASDEIVIGSLLAPGDYDERADIFARLVIQYGGASDIFSVRTQGDAVTPLRAYNGANNMRLKIFYESGVTFGGGTDADINLEGSVDGSSNFDASLGPVTVSCQVSHNGSAVTTTWGELVTAINSHAGGGTGDASDFVLASAGGTTTNVVNATNIDEYLWETANADAGIAAVDGQIFKFDKSYIDTFFSSNEMVDGDCLVFRYNEAEERLKESGVDVSNVWLTVMHRDENDPPTSTTDISLPPFANDGSFVPVCKVVDTRLHFMNGAVFSKDETGRMVDNMLRSDLADQDAGTGTCGAELVGSDVPSGSPTPQTLTKATVYAQLGEMLGYYNAHVTASADQHYLADLSTTARPFVVVATANGDYTSINAAIDTLRTGGNGGTILVKGGTAYTEQIVLSSALSDDITVIGEGQERHGGSSGVLVQSSSGNPIISITTALNARLVFKNINFLPSADTDEVVSVDVGDGGSPREGASGLVFEDCAFQGRASGVEIFDSATSIDCRGCTFRGASVALGFTLYHKTGASTPPYFSFQDCKFDGFDSLAYIGKAGEDDDSGTFMFKRNRIRNCGAHSGTDAITHLIESETGASTDTVNFFIDDNVWEDDGGTATIAGLFCNLRGRGSITNNMLLRSPANALYTHDSTNLPYMIEVTGSDGASGYHGVTISGNTVAAGTSCALRAVDHAYISGNALYSDPSTGTNSTRAIVYLYQRCVFTGNVVDASNLSSDATEAHAALWVESEGLDKPCSVTDNTISGVPITNTNVCTGIIVEGERNVFRGNHLTAASGTAGGNRARGMALNSGADMNIVVGNDFSNFTEVALLTSADRNVINSNVMLLNAYSTSIGVNTATAALENAIVGNVIAGTAAGQIGIVLVSGANNNCTTGNTIDGTFTVPISDAGTNNGGYIDAATTLDVSSGCNY